MLGEECRTGGSNLWFQGKLSHPGGWLALTWTMNPINDWIPLDARYSIRITGKYTGKTSSGD